MTKAKAKVNAAIAAMLKTPGTHYITDPSQLKNGPNGEPAKQDCMPVYVDDDGNVFQLHKGNQIGQKLDPAIFRADSVVLKDRFRGRRRLAA